MSVHRTASDMSVTSEGSASDVDTKFPVSDRLKRYVTQKRTYNYFGPFTVEEVSIKAARRDDEGVGLYDIHVQCLGGYSWMITLRYAQLYESYKWQVKYDKDLKLPLTCQFPPKDSNCMFYKRKYMNDEALEARRLGLEKWINGRVELVHTYESQPDIMKNIKMEMSHLLRIGQYGPSLHQYNRPSLSDQPDVEIEASFSIYGRESTTGDEECLHVDEPPHDEGADKTYDNNDNDMTRCKSMESIKEEDGSLDGVIGGNNNRPPCTSQSHVTSTVPAPPSSSWLFTQCRSIWTPKNWLYLVVACAVGALWTLEVHVVYAVLLVSVWLEFCRRGEDHLLFVKNPDVIADRECSLSGMVRWVFVGLTALCYLVLNALNYAFAISRVSAEALTRTAAE